METSEFFYRKNTKWWKKRAAPLIIVLAVAGWHATGHSDPDNAARPRLFHARAGDAPMAEKTLPRSPKKSMPSIRDPGPDFADFPNSAEVVPPGVYYVEIEPTVQWSNQSDSRQWGLESLFRTGIVEGLELRLFGSAISVIDSDEPGQDTVGSGPFGIGFKYHARDGSPQWFRPAVGIEFQAVLPVASSNELNPEVVLPSGSLNVDHTLPANFSFHWNLGFQTSLDEGQDSFLQACFQWSVAYDFTRDFQLYLTGDSTYPANPSDDSGRHFLGMRIPSDGGWSHFVGVGFLWTVSEQVATYTLVAPEFATGSGYVGGTAQIGVSFAF